VSPLALLALSFINDFLYALAPSFRFHLVKDGKANDNIRKQILKLIEKVHSFADNSNPTAMLEIDHYVSALNQQLKNCDETDAFIKKLVKPFGKINSEK
jgi:hypothetical protein